MLTKVRRLKLTVAYFFNTQERDRYMTFGNQLQFDYFLFCSLIVYSHGPFLWNHNLL